MWRWLIYGSIGVMASGILAFATLRPVKVLPRIRLAPGFVLIDQDGQPLSSEDLRGKIVLYSFTYSRCHSPTCRYITDTMRQVQEGLKGLELGDVPVSLVTISFDPAHDTPEALRAYAKSVGADPSVWRFATGEDATRLKYVIGGGFEVYYARNADGSFTFDPVFVLVDGWGIIRGEYRYRTLTPDVQRILRHIRVVAEEAQHSKGTGRLAYEAAHWFLCYAQ